MSRWCEAYRGRASEMGSEGMGEVTADGNSDEDERPRMSLLAYAESVTLEVDSEIPF